MTSFTMREKGFCLLTRCPVHIFNYFILCNPQKCAENHNERKDYNGLRTFSVGDFSAFFNDKRVLRPDKLVKGKLHPFFAFQEVPINYIFR